MTQEQKDLLLKDLCGRIPYGVKVDVINEDNEHRIATIGEGNIGHLGKGFWIECKPYLFPFSSMTDEDYAIYSKIWEDTGKTAYLGGCHHLICTIKAYNAGNDYLLSKHYDINGLIPMGLAEDAAGKNIY